MKPFQITTFFALFGFVAMQFIQIDKTNPPVEPSLSVEQQTAMSPQVAGYIGRACRDCHTHETVYPLHSYVFPVSLLVEHDVQKGRDNLNFSIWGTYDSHVAWVLLDEICKQVRQDAMPPRRYLLMHPEARLDDAAKEAICKWTTTEKQKYQ